MPASMPSQHIRVRVTGHLLLCNLCCHTIDTYEFALPFITRAVKRWNGGMPGGYTHPTTKLRTPSEAHEERTQQFIQNDLFSLQMI